ncbi:polyribonucleotide nucleotidyltransferase [Saprolegnia diclina VS20]|uniref:polyribonucleotide nucleotidyltransferase n=1 Tax=Saprolegnia diclina (strain VS20) TaxID=1156394 RepID=T0RLI4_SAPDV|nr:polyribonucleotide nucleotidyltransferase [Saprolegnia diclina VS20]EQC33168.1 polyribonucleotide nucleotidyltransferase [Saprolegnia diclina VS20]|eukprot:XP_008613291.1 polyribonucleotide nucleotidyltransferase [Saprolegnia diclina VS20]
MLSVSSRRSLALAKQLQPRALAGRSKVFEQHQRTFFGLGDFFKSLVGNDEPKKKQLEAPKEPKAKAPKAPKIDVVAEPVYVPRPQLPVQYAVGKYATLADGSVMARWGDSMLLTTVVSEMSANHEKDFLPLMVDYREKYSATGTIPGGVKRREMMGTDAEILKSRIVDRIVRPLFPKGYCNETQIIATVQSYDIDHDPVVLAVNSASAALTTSNIPWNGPIGCVRVCNVDGRLVCNPTADEKARATLDVLYAATSTRTVMIEAEGLEISEAAMQDALRFAHEHVQPIIAEQQALPAKAKRTFTPLVVPDDLAAVAQALLPELQTRLSSLQAPTTKSQRQVLENDCYYFVKQQLYKTHAELLLANKPLFTMVSHDLVQGALRANLLQGKRVDGRNAEQVRPLSMETGLLPLVHGSSVFSRGDTQALCTVTLGHVDQGLKVRSAIRDNDDYELKNAMLHYEFPPYCVNETGKIGGINRRMLGHGALAEKAVVPLLPSVLDFPFTIRMTSETMGSDGSSSMASVCGVSMALLDAGVPIKSPVAGISVGLVTPGDLYDGQAPIDEYTLLTDILGSEDHYGDMDFKIAGSKDGITAIQLDVKLPGVPLDILCEGISKAKVARMDILSQMNNVLAEARPIKPVKVASSTIVHIDPAMRGALIGTGGSNIREIEAATSCTISCKDSDGLVEIFGKGDDNIELAKAMIAESTFMFRRGQRVEVVVQTIMDFGCVVVPKFAYGKDSANGKAKQGFIHISEMAHSPVRKVSDVLMTGQTLDAWCIFAEKDSAKLSIKALLHPVTGATLGDAEAMQFTKEREDERRKQRAASGFTPNSPRSTHANPSARRPRHNSPRHSNNSSSSSN